jgi:hypothetical protein
MGWMFYSIAIPKGASRPRAALIHDTVSAGENMEYGSRKT